MQRREYLGVGAVAAVLERVGVDDGRGHHERHSQYDQALRVQPALPREVSGQEGQHQQAEIAGVELAVVV